MSDLFEVINNMFTKEESVNSTTEFKESYMTNRFLSMLPDTFLVAVEANRLSRNLPQWATGAYIFNSIPKHKRAPRMNYIRRPLQYAHQEALKKIGQFFCCDINKAFQIKKILEVNEIDTHKMFGLKKK